VYKGGDEMTGVRGEEAEGQVPQDRAGTGIGEVLDGLPIYTARQTRTKVEADVGGGWLGIGRRFFFCSRRAVLSLARARVIEAI
jgi:hypothetical protein